MKASLCSATPIAEANCTLKKPEPNTRKIASSLLSHNSPASLLAMTLLHKPSKKTQKKRSPAGANDLVVFHKQALAYFIVLPLSS